MTYTSEYPIFYVTVDIAVLTIREQALHVLVVRRSEDPYADQLALPGGFVHPDEDLLTAAERELREETGVEHVVLEQLRTYGDPDRDPRGNVISAAHWAVVPAPLAVQAGTDAAEAEWRPVAGLLEPGAMAFDHAQVLADAVERVRAKLEYTTLATAFTGKEFTLSELRGVYEVVWGVELDPGNFQRKMRHTEDLLVPTGGHRRSPVGRGRPASVFRVRPGGPHLLSNPVARADAVTPRRRRRIG